METDGWRSCCTVGKGWHAAWFGNRYDSSICALCVVTTDCGGIAYCWRCANFRRDPELARSLNIPLTTLDEHPELDLTIDGTDEIDGQLNLIKGGGGALLREKIVASAARRFVVIADITKQVTVLGTHMPLPVEVIPFGVTPVRKRIEALGAKVQVRQLGDQVFITDNGNVILDCTFASGIPDPITMEQRIRSIVGVVETGLFLHMDVQAIIGGPDGVKVVSA